ncbi:MAG TPA: cytochrome c oxidase assembly protein [Chloroflexota bacterium]|nr:cytochrome c oxidase assembly protein [Chloroflexota bacterium]
MALHWTFEPGVIAGLLCLSVGYALAATRFRRPLVRAGGPPPRWLPPGAMAAERAGHLAPRQVICFYLAILVLALALLSPLHALGERYLLTAHMVQHLAVTQVAAPLLLLGLPGWLLRPLFRLAPIRQLASRLLIPIPAFLLFNVVYVGWHAPWLYDASLQIPLLHAVEHGLFLALALVTWWPVLGPLPELPRLPHGAQVMYLFFQSLPPTILGAIITLAQVPLYATYWAAPRVPGFLGFPSLSPIADQELGGLTMWIPGALGYFLVLSIIWFQWLERRSPRETPPYADVNPDRARQARLAARSVPSPSSPSR